MPYIPALDDKNTLDLTKVEDAVWFDVGEVNAGHMVVELVGGTWATAVVEVKYGVVRNPGKLTSFSSAIIFTISSDTLTINGVDGLTGIKYLAVIVTTANASDREIKPTLWAEPTVSRG